MLSWTKTLMWSRGQQEQHSRNQDRQKVPGQRLVDLKLSVARRRRTLRHSRKTVCVHSANEKEPVCHSRSYIPQEIAVKHLASSTPASPAHVFLPTHNAHLMHRPQIQSRLMSYHARFDIAGCVVAAHVVIKRSLIKNLQIDVIPDSISHPIPSQ